MGVEDKFNNSTENTTGKVKEGVGRVTDNEQLEAEGRADQTRANIKQAGEKIKDAFRS
ncbi:CsbD family protein [Micromonospora sp. NPDC048871]|uniref:CsbD family protein n=1 Tax=unclassified Micromonospora TaxID=2617518 RepID=UPI002E145769|nr:CsbD family protein [Micromonospora sp. NBC_01739]